MGLLGGPVRAALLLVTLVACGRIDEGDGAPPASPLDPPAAAPIAPAPDEEPSPPKRGVGQVNLFTTNTIGVLAAWFTAMPRPEREPAASGCWVKSFSERIDAVKEVDAGVIELTRATEARPVASLHWDPKERSYEPAFVPTAAGIGDFVIRGTGGDVPSFATTLTPIRSLAIATSTAIGNGDLGVDWETDETLGGWIEVMADVDTIATCSFDPGVRSVTIPRAVVGKVLEARKAEGHPSSCTACARVSVSLYRSTAIIAGNYGVAVAHVHSSEASIAIEAK